MSIIGITFGNLIRHFAWCQCCLERTDQQYEGPHWRCLSCNRKIDREGKIVK